MRGVKKINGFKDYSLCCMRCCEPEMDFPNSLLRIVMENLWILTPLYYGLNILNLGKLFQNHNLIQTSKLKDGGIQILFTFNSHG